jgi:hypothetical protein
MNQSLFDGIGEAPKYGAYSHTKLDGGCNLKFFKTYVEKEEKIDSNKFETDEGLAIHAFAELEIDGLGDDVSVEERVDRLIMSNPQWGTMRYDLMRSAKLFRDKFVPTINQRLIVGSELELGCDLHMRPSGFWDPMCWFRGKVDYMEVERGVVRVVDFKNYPRLHDEEELSYKGAGVGAQIMGYVALAMSLDPTIEQGIGQIYYTRYGVTRETEPMSRAEVNEWWKYNQHRMIAMERRRTWTAQPSRKACSYCPFLETCTYSKGPDNYVARNENEAAELGKRLIIAEEEIARLKVGISAFLDVSKTQRIALDGKNSIGLTERVEREINSEEVFRIAHDAGLDPFKYVSANYTAVKDLMKSITNPEHKEALSKAVVETVKTSRKLT